MAGPRHWRWTVSINSAAPAEADLPRLGRASILTRLAWIGAALAAVAATVAYLRRVGAPEQPTPPRVRPRFSGNRGGPPRSPSHPSHGPVRSLCLSHQFPRLPLS